MPPSFDSWSAAKRKGWSCAIVRATSGSGWAGSDLERSEGIQLPGGNVDDKTTMKPAFRTADRVRIRYAETGRGVGETVVLTCPWPESLFAFRKVWGRLAKRFHVIAIDLPGFGQSDRRLDLYAPKAMGAFLVNLINEWQLGPVHFVGPDVGTSAQLWAAATNPALVRSLAIGGGAMAIPLQTGGALKTIIEAPN